ncbi:hypothetical protein AMS68_006288 [Peltaster fructicola]|uniref:Uncharacterized protein n=1 Tax=Peltaster fructicola TaxID=286661 RepID=A0A6H0Y1H4_9PEZI|nr:hypothetical protein AMS68_006288 [Peltaster fructicola]
MSSQRYERIAHDDSDSPITPQIPNSPPPSFRSHASSRRASRDEQSEQDRNLHDAFDAPSDSEDEEDDTARSQRRLISRRTSGFDSPINGTAPSAEEQTISPVAERPTYTTSAPSGRVYGGGNVTDGVFANLSAKPRAGEDLEEKPPTYEQAAADATPPYWETTVLSPYGHSGNPDDVFVDGLLVGSLFSFVWNMLISIAFQLIGFLLCYLLHTTHAAKHGSRAGLGVTLLQFGFQMRYSSMKAPVPAQVDGVPSDPNSHDFDPNAVSGRSGLAGLSSSDWFSYVLMIAGWFILIKAVTDFMRARRQEALVRSSPDRGLGIAVVAEGERPESSV